MTSVDFSSIANAGKFLLDGSAFLRADMQVQQVSSLKWYQRVIYWLSRWLHFDSIARYFFNIDYKALKINVESKKIEVVRQPSDISALNAVIAVVNQVFQQRKMATVEEVVGPILPPTDTGSVPLSTDIQPSQKTDEKPQEVAQETHETPAALPLSSEYGTTALISEEQPFESIPGHASETIPIATPLPEQAEETSPEGSVLFATAADEKTMGAPSSSGSMPVVDTPLSPQNLSQEKRGENTPLTRSSEGGGESNEKSLASSEMADVHTPSAVVLAASRYYPPRSTSSASSPPGAKKESVLLPPSLSCSDIPERDNPIFKNFDNREENNAKKIVALRKQVQEDRRKGIISDTVMQQLKRVRHQRQRWGLASPAYDPSSEKVEKEEVTPSRPTVIVSSSSPVPEVSRRPLPFISLHFEALMSAKKRVQDTPSTPAGNAGWNFSPSPSPYLRSQKKFNVTVSGRDNLFADEEDDVKDDGGSIKIDSAVINDIEDLVD